MKIVLTGSEESRQALKKTNENIDWIEVESTKDFNDHINADAFFNLNNDAAAQVYSPELKLIFINSVIIPLKDIEQNKNLIRFNGWNGFLQRDIWEVSGNIHAAAEKIFRETGKKFTAVADEPGFISARILAMIINEAYFARGENVSTETEIDIAMKLGTNYPKGPFEWAELIGKQNILLLLNRLTQSDLSYTPAPLLVKESAITS
ncbi:MAG: 3-hydroxyacyl-CoA dehydrogenase family protein [Ferruginibacter sp.]